VSPLPCDSTEMKARSWSTVTAASLVFGGVTLHTVEQFVLGEAIHPLFYALSLLPYVLCVGVLGFSGNAIPVIAGVLVALLIDGIVHYEVFTNPQASTASVALFFAPLWSALLFVPIAILVTKMILRRCSCNSSP
jgi:hypothetical protein